jgi:hypothetical protein
MLKRPSAAVLAVLLTAAVALPATATTAVQLDEQALVDTADLIVVGRCDAVDSRWVDGDLVTIATLEVSESLKGGAGGSVDVVLPGGVDADAAVPVAVTWPGAPAITPGEKVLVFLVDYPSVPGGYAVAGFSQGKYSVIEGPAVGSSRVSRDLTNVTLVDGEDRRRGAASQERLDVFLDRVRGLVAAGEVER